MVLEFHCLVTVAVEAALEVLWQTYWSLRQSRAGQRGSADWWSLVTRVEWVGL